MTKALAGHVAEIAADLRAQILAGGAPGERARRLHAEEQVGDDFEVWTDLLARRAAVLWVLKSVYVRVLEDRGLLRPGRILDREAQQLFERLAPNLGESAFLSWVWRDLASANGGLPELFATQPAEVAVPSAARSRALLDFWRKTDADTGFRWSFATEIFAGELMGDLYQELDPVVKDRYALCQTPAFVRDFMLARTLEPAIEEFGADDVRVLDPACGSGHFLLDALRRLVEAMAPQHADWPRDKVIDSVLGRVVGIDINDYACALARARMVMTAAELAGVASLAEAARFRPNVYWADGLEQIERDPEVRHEQIDLLEPSLELQVRASLPRPAVRALLRPILKEKFHVVVGNPPYKPEKDDSRKTYHRDKVSKRRRYLSAYGEYSLAAPFTERALQLTKHSGRVGLIVANNFMRRDFGRPLIERVLASVDLELVVDTSHARIQDHGTPTAMLFARCQPPTSLTVRVVMGRRDEGDAPVGAGQGAVWSSIVEWWHKAGFENEFLSVADVPRATLAKYPWSLGGGGAEQLKRRLDEVARRRLGEECADIGRTTVCGGDAVFMLSPGEARRRGACQLVVALAVGEVVRDWAIDPQEFALYPYQSMGGDPTGSDHPAVFRHFWPFRTFLRGRTVFGRTPEQRGKAWYEHLEHYADRLLTPLAIGFAFVATHNHFALDRGGILFNRTSPAIKLAANSTADDHLALVSFLNSSTACFWMKQVFQPRSHAGQKHHPDPERCAYEFTVNGMAQVPIPKNESFRSQLVALGSIADESMRGRGAVLAPNYWAFSLGSRAELASRLEERWKVADHLRQRAIFAQEELDWLSYHLFGLVPTWLRAPAGGSGTLPRGQRAFERALGHRSFVRQGGRLLPPSEGEVETGPTSLPEAYADVTARRQATIASNDDIALIETYLYKRLWRDTEDNVSESVFRERHDRGQLRAWLADRVESVVERAGGPIPIAKMVVALQDDREFLAVSEVLEKRAAFDILRLVSSLVNEAFVPNHALHIYTDSGLKKRAAWEETWRLQRLEDEGQRIENIPVPPKYSQGSRGKSKDFLRNEYWQLRGSLDVPKERFIAFTEMPGRSAGEILYGWAGWTPVERVKALLALDEICEDEGHSLGDRIALLDSAWRLLPDVIRDDPATGARLKAELQALVGPDGPAKVLLDEWKKKFPPPNIRVKGGSPPPSVRADSREGERS
ncbi:MAG: BREX-2 system adenine-specific DNA-methyltransferase PglX [Deltaproteobacteria bacterium]|nr:BREX-2 system adenine-specific DNA-methyltransferase PglX [Deltaproteobacteria bacterium]